MKRALLGNLIEGDDVFRIEFGGNWNFEFAKRGKQARVPHYVGTKCHQRHAVYASKSTLCVVSIEAALSKRAHYFTSLGSLRQ
jgi:hypothetical protein